jgi:DNA-directed RNA polymerase specialized sigma24 family protein
MGAPERVILLDASGRPLRDDIQQALRDLVPRLQHEFPALPLRDPTELTKVLEQVGRQIAAHPSISNMHGYAWVALRGVATSRLRQSDARVMLATVGTTEGAVALARVAVDVNSAAQIERDILWRELLARLTAEERQVCVWKLLGRSSKEIAELRGTSVGAVDTMFFRIKEKLRAAVRKAEQSPDASGMPVKGDKDAVVFGSKAGGDDA